MEATNAFDWRAKTKLTTLHLSRTHRYNIEGATTSRRIVNLSLESLPDDSQDLIERFSFNPELKEATLRLNGMHKGKPAITVPIAFDKFKDFDRSCIEHFQNELDKYSELGQLEKVDILGVLVDDANKSLILDTIKDYSRDNLHHESTPEQEQQEKEGWEDSYYDVWGRKVPEQENLKFNKMVNRDLLSKVQNF